jgi:predicted PurR-regulated permease PerM
MKLDKKFIIGSIIIPIIIALSIAYVQLQQQENIQLLERINNAENIAKTCNISNKNEVLSKLTQARYYWAYKNYSISEELLNSVRNDIANCIIVPPKLDFRISFIIVLIIIIVITYYLIKQKKREKRNYLCSYFFSFLLKYFNYLILGG